MYNKDLINSIKEPMTKIKKLEPQRPPYSYTSICPDSNYRIEPSAPKSKAKLKTT